MTQGPNNRSDTLGFLDDSIPLTEKLEFLHRQISERYPFIRRIAVALYDPKTDELKTFIHSREHASPLSHFHARLSELPTLAAIARERRPRVIDDNDLFAGGSSAPLRLVEGGASYVMPMFLGGQPCGFIFFSARQSDAFPDEVLHALDLFGHLLSLTVVHELQNLRTLFSAIDTAREITHHRDIETGAHLDRMARYVRAIATHMAPHYGFADEFVEHLCMFAPLHDIGKISIPDRILFKNAGLNSEEFETMRSHTVLGRQLVDTMLDNFGLQNLEHSDTLRHIVELHHEALDGSGYPYGLTGDQIPIEARIVAVADVFDAMTSRRPYKDAWKNQDAFDALAAMAGNILDPDCVEALFRNLAEIENIQREFREDAIG